MGDGWISGDDNQPQLCCWSSWASQEHHEEPLYLTIAQVAALLQISERTVYRWASTDPTLPVLRVGGGTLRFPRGRLLRWLEEHEYESLRQMQGSMSLERCDNPRAYERANYMKILQSWQPERR